MEITEIDINDYQVTFFPLFRNIIGFWNANNKRLYWNDLLRSEMRDQLNIFVFGISQNLAITMALAYVLLSYVRTWIQQENIY